MPRKTNPGRTAEGLAIRQRILTSIDCGHATVRKLMAELDMSENGIRHHIGILNRQGLIAYSGDKPKVWRKV